MANVETQPTTRSDVQIQPQELRPEIVPTVGAIDIAMPSIRGASHIAFTVRDMNASADWYQRVFSWIVLRSLTSAEAGTPRVLLYDPESGFVVGLCEPDDRSGDSFDYRRTGLDHFAFRVADESELDRWIGHLEGVGVPHSPVRVTELGRFISFEDPDGIQFEFWLNASR